MSFSVGSLVKARDREWVVLPNSTDALVHLRPLGGAKDEETAVLTALEEVEPATFDLPNPEQIGDYRSARLLRSALRLGFRASAGPFRSFARINVDPRPYQLVPLLMALKQDPVRLLIADDVGIGKTIEALLIARELLDRGEIERLAVLCPPQLAEQWQRELHEKFHIDAELVLPSTAPRLERDLRRIDSLFDRHKFTVVSTDFIKSDRRRQEFINQAPEFIIVDEAHTVVHAPDRQSGRHQRAELVEALAAKAERHLVLVTATPHSGKEEAFHALLALLNPDDFKELPDDLTGAHNDSLRREIARYFVQRRRVDISRFLDESTDFPERATTEKAYELSKPYKQLFDRALRYARELVNQPGEGYRRRVRWWSALALLQSMASSPAAAAATLRSRAPTAEVENEAKVDEIGLRSILGEMYDASAEATDAVPGSDIWHDDNENPQRRRLLDMAREAEKLSIKDDRKLQGLIDILKPLLKDGYSPIVFCRFIPTVEYLQTALRKVLKDVEIGGVTGRQPPAEREQRVAQLAESSKRVLVCTDCLSEGINLQHNYDAIVHYDLSWNPTRHEQRDGRVDRYGQPRKTVKVATYYGIDNQIDGVVLDVLLRKHEAIRNSLGISVPVPGNTEDVIEAIFKGLLMRENADIRQRVLPGFELALQWDVAATRERQSRTMFAQRAINVEEVAKELQAARQTIESVADIESFMYDAVRMHNGTVSKNGVFKFDLSESPRGLRDMLGKKEFSAVYDIPVHGAELLTRTHPIVESLANFVMNTALDTTGAVDDQPGARRAGAIRTTAVTGRTTLVLLRLRYHLISTMRATERQLLAEDSLTLAFTGSPQDARWLDMDEWTALLRAKPDKPMNRPDATYYVRLVIDDFDCITKRLDELTQQRGDELLAAHVRVRDAAYRSGERRPKHRVKPQLPPDVLGLYVFLPVLES